MSTATLVLIKDQLDIAMLSVRDSYDWYKTKARNAQDEEAFLYYSAKAQEYLDVAEIFSINRRKLIQQKMQGVTK